MKVTRVNIQELLSRVEQDRDLLHELLSIFVEEFPVKLQELRDALAREDLARAGIVSHGLKGMLSNLSIAQAASCAAQIELMARKREAASAKEALEALEKEVQGLLPELQGHLAEVRR
jgi:HPt (histidine-containing phosphotransfer) domain-containing protein